MLHSWLPDQVLVYSLFYSIPISLLSTKIIYLRNNSIHQDSSIARNIDPSVMLSIYWEISSCSLWTLVTEMIIQFGIMYHTKHVEIIVCVIIILFYCLHYRSNHIATISIARHLLSSLIQVVSHVMLLHCAFIRFGLALIPICSPYHIFFSHTVISISIHHLMFKSGCTPYWFVPPLRFRSCRGICSLNALT